MGKMKNEKGFALLEILILIIILAILGLVGFRALQLSSEAQKPLNPTPGIAFPKEQRFTDDAQFKILKAEEAALKISEFGDEYTRSEGHQGITGGFYSGQKI